MDVKHCDRGGAIAKFRGRKLGERDEGKKGVAIEIATVVGALAELDNDKGGIARDSEHIYTYCHLLLGNSKRD